MNFGSQHSHYELLSLRVIDFRRLQKKLQLEIIKYKKYKCDNKNDFLDKYLSICQRSSWTISYSYQNRLPTTYEHQI